MSFFVKACAEALREFPGLNAEMRGDAIAYKKFTTLASPSAVAKDLWVRCAWRRQDGLADIEKGIAELAQKPKENKLQLSICRGNVQHLERWCLRIDDEHAAAQHAADREFSGCTTSSAARLPPETTSKSVR